MSLFETRITNDELKKLRKELKKALIACQKGYTKAHEIRVSAYPGHGPEGKNISEADARRARECYCQATKDLANELHRIVADLDNHIERMR